MKTKSELISALIAAGAEGIDENLTVSQLQAAAAQYGVSLKKETLKPEFITVTVTAPLAENGAHYNAGDTLETTPERAAALGALVKPAEAV